MTPAAHTPPSGVTTSKPADALAVKLHAVWVATVIAPPNRPAIGYDIIRLDPQTLRRTLLIHIV